MVFKIVILTLILCAQAWGLSPRDSYYIMRFYNDFLEQGVPEKPLNETLLYFMENWNKQLTTFVKKNKKMKAKLTNSRFIALIDFNKSSIDKRFWILDLKTGIAKPYWVSHGAKTGGHFAYHFSNVINSWQTSLGFYLTGPRYTGQFGKSLKLYGLSSTNDQAFERDIVLHPAKYVSYEFAFNNLRIGRSHGCFAVSFESLDEILKALPPGSLIYAYHDQIFDQTQKTKVPENDEVELTEEERTQRP